MHDMKIPEGLFYYEYILLLLGIALFLVMLVLLILFALQKRQLKQLTFFFLIPIIMIGFPGIQKIKYEDGALEIEKYITQLNASGNNREVETELRDKLQKFEKRAQTNPNSSTLFGQAYASVGDTLRAMEYINTALSIAPQHVEAKQLMKSNGNIGLRPTDTLHSASPSNSLSTRKGTRR